MKNVISYILVFSAVLTESPDEETKSMDITAKVKSTVEAPATCSV